MTVAALIKKLQTMPPRAKVSVVWRTFKSHDYSHEEIIKVELETIGIDTEGGGSPTMLVSGREKTQRVVSLKGIGS